VAQLIDHPFGGSDLCAVDAAGRLRLPRFVRETLNRRGAGSSLIVGTHEADPCLIAYEPAFAAVIHADVERRRIAEQPVAPHLHHARVRRAFGWVAEAGIENENLTVPPLMRRRARIGDLALIVGTGGTFEIWDARRALDSGDADLRELAAFHLDARHAA
jgi:MraZ protein